MPEKDASFLFDKPPVGEPALHEPALSEPAQQEPALREPALHEPVLAEPTLREPIPHKPALDGPALDGPALAASGKPSFDELAVGEPSYDELAVGEPPYDELAFGEPAFGEPAFGREVELDDGPVDFADRDDDTSDEPPSPGRRRALLIAIGGAAVLCAASAVAFGPRVYHVASEHGSTVTTPPQIGDLRRNTSPDAQSTADYIRAAVASAGDLNASIGDVYTSPGGTDQNSIIFAGGTASNWTPSGSLKDILAVVSDDNGGVSNLKNVPTGKLGGVAECGVTKTDGADMQVCAWADYASVGIVLFPNRDAADAANLFATLRPAIEHRG